MEKVTKKVSKDENLQHRINREAAKESASDKIEKYKYLTGKEIT